MHDPKLSITAPRLDLDETLVPDARAGLTPSQMVDGKLALQLGLAPRSRTVTDAGLPPPAQAATRQPTSSEARR